MDLDRSKPYVPILERSSQLIEESFSHQEARVEIDVTPLAARRRGGRSKKAKKRSIESVEREVCVCVCVCDHYPSLSPSIHP